MSTQNNTAQGFQMDLGNQHMGFQFPEQPGPSGNFGIPGGPALITITLQYGSSKEIVVLERTYDMNVS